MGSAQSARRIQLGGRGRSRRGPADLLCWDRPPRGHGRRRAHFLRRRCAATGFGSAGKAGGFGRWLAAPRGECYSPPAGAFAVPPESREVTAAAPSRRVIAGGERARRAPGGTVDRGGLSSVRPNRVSPPSRAEPRRAGARGPRRCR